MRFMSRMVLRYHQPGGDHILKSKPCLNTWDVSMIQVISKRLFATLFATFLFYQTNTIQPDLELHLQNEIQTLLASTWDVDGVKSRSQCFFMLEVVAPKPMVKGKHASYFWLLQEADLLQQQLSLPAHSDYLAQPQLLQSTPKISVMPHKSNTHDLSCEEGQ